MTDGIIQKVFKRYLSYYNSYDNRSFGELEQELIQEIKKLEMYNQIHDRWYLEKIIGDNQE